MKKSTSLLWVLLSFLGGLLIGVLITVKRNGICCGNGCKFYGSDFKDVARLAGKGIANLSGSEFYSDHYIDQKLKG